MELDLTQVNLSLSMKPGFLLEEPLLQRGLSIWALPVYLEVSVFPLLSEEFCLIGADL